MRPAIFTTLLSLTFLLAHHARAQTVRYVTTTGTNANPATATSWQTATSDLQGAINASAPSDQVWVATGTYKPGGPANTDRSLSFSMRNGVAIYGGFAGNETSVASRPPTSPSGTILSGDIGRVNDATDNSYHVVSNGPGLTATAVLDGVVITGGNANRSPDPLDASLLGGLRATGGGGMFNDGSTGSCDPSLRNCVFQGNTAKDFGGAMVNYNTASPVLTNCQFLSNSATNGGGIVSLGNNLLTLTNCSFRLNAASGLGGAFYVNSALGGSTLVALNCLFQSNVAPNGGVFGNAGEFGNQVSGTLTLLLTNCTLTGNSATAQASVLSNAGPLVTVLTNCIVWGNGGSVVANTTPFPFLTASYCFFDASVTGITAGQGMVVSTTSPFASAGSAQLSAASVAINGGSPTSTTATVGRTDLAGNPRLVNCRVDMGALEVQVPGRFYVRAAATGNNNGLSWENAFTDLQSALADCAQGPALTEVWVARGTYYPTPTRTDRTASFRLRGGLAIYGGFAGNETDLSQRPAINPDSPSGSLLSGDINRDNLLTGNSYHVLACEPGNDLTVTIDGFSVKFGYADVLGTEASEGGGMYVVDANFTARNCLFGSNESVSTGGGVIAISSGLSNRNQPQFINCVFRDNYADSGSGGGGGVATLSQARGSSTRFINCLFVNNGTLGNGGAVLNAALRGSLNTLVLINCSFQANSASQLGGAVANRADQGGGVLSQFFNCSFQRNRASATGPFKAGGVIANKIGNPNQSSGAQLSNCVLWDNGGDNTFDADVRVGTSLLEPTVINYISDPGNLTTTTTPFASATDTRLRPGSPAIDAGSNTIYTTANGPATDLASNPRVVGAGIDMGAYEVQSALPVMLRYFSGRMTDAGTRLGWATAREENNAHFQIERSPDARSFESIATVPTQAVDGNSITELTYSYLDAQPLPGTTYYRLTQTDRDGTRTTHNIIALSREGQVPVLFPNPVSADGEAVIEPAMPHTGYQITDVLGRIVQRQDAPGVLSRVSLAGLPVGVYVLRVQTDAGGTRTWRLLR